MKKRFIFILVIVSAIALCLFISIANRRITLHSQYFSTWEIYTENSAKESTVEAFIDELKAKQDFMVIPEAIENSGVRKLLKGKETKPQLYMENNHFYIFYTYKSFGKKYIDVIAGKVEALQDKTTYQEEIWETQSAEEKVSADGKTVQVEVASRPSGRTREKLSGQLELKLNENKRLKLLYDSKTDTLKYVDDKVKINTHQIDFMAFAVEADAVLRRCTTVSTVQKQKDSLRLSSIRNIEYKEQEVKYMDAREETYIKAARNQDNILINELGAADRGSKGIIASFKLDPGQRQIPAASMTTQFIFNQGSDAEIVYQYSFQCKY